LVLSGMAVVAGFVATVGLIRTMAPAEQPTTQNAQTSSSRRAASLLPVRASSSESGSESGSAASDGSNGQTAATQGQDTSKKVTVTPSTGAQPASSGQATASTPSGQIATPPSSNGTGGAATPPSSGGGGGSNEGTACTLTDMLGLPIVGHIVGGVCTLI